MADAPVALITGASSGIGRELARVHAARGGDVVLVARRREALDTLKAELESSHGVRATVVPANLADPEAPKTIYATVTGRGITVDYLINNAGFGGHGRFHERPWTSEDAMIQVNVTALSELTHLFLQDMVARGHGRILNVASTAAFLPGPLQAVYYASKAYVLSFSQAIAEELAGTGVRVTALCPGPVDSEFARVADLEGARLFEGGTERAADVAAKGYAAMRAGRLVAITDRKLAVILRAVLPFLPRRVVLALSRRSQEKT